MYKTFHSLFYQFIFGFGFARAFDRKVSWGENVKIMAWVCLVSKHRKLTGWFILQCIKQGSTLRISRKREKPSPRIVFQHGRQDGEILRFLQYR